MRARLGWLALGVLVGAAAGRVAARRAEPGQAPPVLAAATRVALGTTPPADPGSAGAVVAEEAPDAPPAAAPPAPAPDTAVGAPTTPERPRPTPRPRPRPEPSGRHAWVPPEESGTDPAPPEG